MPISYSCPHCGKQFSVAEQYAGQTGPCAGCGKPITIALPAGGAPLAYGPQPVRSGIGIVAMVGVGVAVVAVLVVITLLPAMQAIRESTLRSQANGGLTILALAMHNYHDIYKALPPAVITDPDGKPLYSGRVLLLPYIGRQDLFDQYDKMQAWDGPANAALSKMELPAFRVRPSEREGSGQTDFLFVTGKGTALEVLPNGTSFADIFDGTSNTLFMVEVKNSGINWAQPQDLDFSQPISLPPGNCQGGNMAVFYDGRTTFISHDAQPNTIYSLATRAGGEPAVGGL